MYRKVICKFVHFERSYNVSKLVKIQHLILAMFVSNTRERMRKGRLVKCIHYGTHRRFKNCQSASETSDSCQSTLKTKFSKPLRNRGSVQVFRRQGNNPALFKNCQFTQRTVMLHKTRTFTNI